MEGTKSFTRSKEDIINAIYDIIELQKGELILSDKRHGLIHFELTMYGYLWELFYKIDVLRKWQGGTILSTFMTKSYRPHLSHWLG